jgi:hypothetical protein
VLIQRLMEGFTPFGLGAGGAHLGEVVTSDGTLVFAASVMARVCLPELVSEGHQTLLPCDDGALSTVKFPFSGKELDLQLGDHYRGGNQGPTPVNKQRLTSR